MLVSEKEKLTVLEGSRIFGVSADTMRRDFARLSKHGEVIRTHGGIISKKSVSFDPSITEKTVQHEEEIANQIVVIADYSKINSIALYSFASFEDIDVLITDTDADKGFLTELENYDVEVLLAD